MIRYDLATKRKSEHGFLEAYIIDELNKKQGRENEQVLQLEIEENRCDEQHRPKVENVIVIEL